LLGVAEVETVELLEPVLAGEVVVVIEDFLVVVATVLLLAAVVVAGGEVVEAGPAVGRTPSEIAMPISSASRLSKRGKSAVGTAA